MTDDLAPTGPADPAKGPALEGWLRTILRCPACQSTFTDATAPDGSPELACDGCDRAYRIDEGIPVLLVDEARSRADASDEARSRAGASDEARSRAAATSGQE